MGDHKTGLGWEYMFLQNGFNVNVSDGVERGRASWAQFPEINPVPPCFNSYAERWTTYRLGPKYGESYAGSRFDAAGYDTFIKSQVPRWTTSIPMAQKAYDQYVGDMKDGCIMLAHSQGGLFTVNAALAHPENVKAVVLIESSSTIDVEKTDVSAFKDIPFLFVWGDFLGEEYCTPEYRWIGDFAYQGTMRKLHERIVEWAATAPGSTCRRWASAEIPMP
ncbi:MAG: alpha/beta fold hydrolase [Oscillospiraceae bacterium]